MIPLTDYQKIRSTQILKDKIFTLAKQVKSENARIQKLVQLRTENEQRLSTTEEARKQQKRLLLQSENELGQIEKKIVSNQQNSGKMVTPEQIHAYECEMAKLTKRRSELESIILEQLEAVEGSEAIIKQCTSFLAGSVATLAELKVEVTATIQTLTEEMQLHQTKIQQLTKEITSPILKSKFTMIDQRHKDSLSYAYIIDDYCDQCRMKIPKHNQGELDRLVSVEVCPGCHRLFIPYQVMNQRGEF